LLSAWLTVAPCLTLAIAPQPSGDRQHYPGRVPLPARLDVAEKIV
jgi:hypothetical protein